MIVAVASRKGSPGVTTLAALLGAFWHDPGTVRFVVEADPSGGSLAARWSAAHGLTWDPGLLDLSTNRRPLAADLMATVAQPLATDLWVAAAPPGSDQVVSALHRMADAGAAAMASAPEVVTIADCGRLSATSPAMAIARRAALTVVVCRPRLDEVHALIPAIGELHQAGCAPALVCLGDRPYEPVEVARSLGVELLGVLPVDERAAAVLDADGLGGGRAFRRSRLAGAVEELASVVQARCVELVAAPVADSPLPGAVSALVEPLVVPPMPDLETLSPPPVRTLDIENLPPPVLSVPPMPPMPLVEAVPSAEAAPRFDPGSGMDGPLSPAMMAARAAAASRVADRDLDDHR